MTSQLITAQLALFPSKPLQSSEWAQIVAGIHTKFQEFKEGTVKIDSSSAILLSKDSSKEIQIISDKILFICILEPENDTNLREVYGEFIDIFVSSVKSWKRLGVINTYVQERDDTNEYLKKLFVSPQVTWEELVIKITNKTRVNDKDVNQQVQVGEGRYNDNGQITKKGLLSSIDINNVPDKSVVFTTAQIKDEMVKYYDAATPESIKEIFGLNNLNE